MLEKLKETKLHVLIDLGKDWEEGRASRPQERRLDGVAARRGGDGVFFSDVQQNYPVLQTGIPARNKIFMG